jgi:tRNA U34 5-methylaminomethyl-2-thiouridine-forming methyltransferase MnmC
VTELIKTADGSHTLFVPELNEHYHSVHGAIQESDHIFIRNGLEFSQADPVYIFEVGFGTGLNALLTALKSLESNRKIFYVAVEKYPLEPEIIKRLNYSEFVGVAGRHLFELIHMAPWNVTKTISENFSIRKISGDLITVPLDGKYDLIYFDAFGPDKQPEMWTSEILGKIAEVTRRKGLLMTYSAKGEVRRNLTANGFIVTLLPGPPGKRHIIRAVKS